MSGPEAAPPAPRMQAFLNIESGLQARQRVVLGVVRAAGPIGLTLNEIGYRLGKPINQFSGRVSELVDLGLLEPLRINGLTIKRRRQTVWNACDRRRKGVLSRRRPHNRQARGIISRFDISYDDDAGPRGRLVFEVKGAALHAISETLKVGAKGRMAW